jgi:hypothetical protein
MQHKLNEALHTAALRTPLTMQYHKIWDIVAAYLVPARPPCLLARLAQHPLQAALQVASVAPAHAHHNGLTPGYGASCLHWDASVEAVAWQLTTQQRFDLGNARWWLHRHAPLHGSHGTFCSDTRGNAAGAAC